MTAYIEDHGITGPTMDNVREHFLKMFLCWGENDKMKKKINQLNESNNA